MSSTRRINSLHGFSDLDLSHLEQHSPRYDLTAGQQDSYNGLPIPEDLRGARNLLEQSEILNNESFLREHGLSRELTGSRKLWTPPRTSIQENTQRRMERDRFDELALRHNFESKNPSLDVIRRRAQYREYLNFHCLPHGQVFVLLTTYGPDPSYDIQAEQVGVQIWGVFTELRQCEEHVKYIRETNPHAVFFEIHTVQLGQRIDLPPPNDGGSEMHHLNQQHHEIMKKHFRKTIAGAEYSDNRRKEALEFSKEKNKANEEFDKIIKQAVFDVGMSGKTWDSLKEAEEIDKVARNIPVIKNGDQNKTSASRESLEEQSKNVKAVPPQLVEAYMKNIEANNKNLPEGYRVVYRRFTNQEGKEVVARVIQVKKNKNRSQ